jgi:hypothetical protein
MYGKLVEKPRRQLRVSGKRLYPQSDTSNWRSKVSSAWERFDPCRRQNSAAKPIDARKRIYPYNVTTGL